MTSENTISRRGLFMKLGILFNGLVATALTVPIVRFLLSSVTRGRASAYLSWVPLGRVNEFPEGETRLATFTNPYVTPTDGKTVDTACWVRRVEGEQFQVFAINCAHLGCPVRWFPQSGLFMCPCHGGAYYRDGSRASGPPERGFFDFVRIFETPSLLRARCTRAVAIIRSAVARAHEQTGLRKPTNRAAEMRAINGKNLELIASHTPDPARRVHRLTVRRSHVGILKCCQPRLAFRKFADRSERHPGKIGVRAPASNRGQNKSHNGYRKRGRHHAVEQNSH